MRRSLARSRVSVLLTLFYKPRWAPTQSVSVILTPGRYASRPKLQAEVSVLLTPRVPVHPKQS